MAIATYSELQTAVANWLARSDLTTYIPDFITLAESAINRVLRVREQEASADLTVNAQSVALPTGFIGVRRVYMDTTPQTTTVYSSPDAFWNTYASNSSGVPVTYTIEGENIIFGPIPDTTYTGKLLYWKRTDVAASAHTLFTRNPDLFLYGALAHSAPFIGQDERLPMWMSIFAKLLGDVALASAKDRASGTLHMHTDAVGY